MAECTLSFSIFFPVNLFHFTSFEGLTSQYWVFQTTLCDYLEKCNQIPRDLLLLYMNILT